MLQDTMIERKQYQERAILNRMADLRQDCICYLFCTGNKVFRTCSFDFDLISGSKQACEELMRLETKLANGLN